MGKVSSEKILGELFRRHYLDLEIPFRRSLSIDTTNRNPRNVAKSIARQYRLSSYTVKHRGFGHKNADKEIVG